jgi:ArsR family transcriptional regulator
MNDVSHTQSACPCCGTSVGDGDAAELFDPEDLEPSERDERIAELAKALGHPTRVAILRMLADRETCVCGELVEALPYAQSTVSQHLKVLKDAELICGESDGTSMCYCLDPETYRRFRVLLTDVV